MVWAPKAGTACDGPVIHGTVHQEVATVLVATHSPTVAAFADGRYELGATGRADADVVVALVRSAIGGVLAAQPALSGIPAARQSSANAACASWVGFQRVGNATTRSSPIAASSPSRSTRA